MKQLNFFHCAFLCASAGLFAHAGNSQTVFMPNAGQWNNAVQYKADVVSGNVFFGQNKLTYSFYNNAVLESIHEESTHAATAQAQYDAAQKTVPCYAYEVNFPGADPAAYYTGEEKTTYETNYFIGNDPAKWASGLHGFHVLTCRNLYKGVDVRFTGPAGQLKYDFIIDAGTDPSVISMQYSGTRSLILRDGKLIIDAGFMEISEAIPYAYQDIHGERITVRCEFVLQKNTVHFVFPEGYDPSYKVVIDPVVVASTYSGGTCVTYGHGATYDDQGNIYSAGRCYAAGFPATLGAFSVTFSGIFDMGLSKYDPTGSNLIYCTYLGGSLDDNAHSMFVHNNELYVYGSTFSTDYPVTAGAYDVTHNGNSDIVVTHLNASGSALIGSTYVGGSGSDGFNQIILHIGDGFRSEMVVDGAGDVFIAGATSSTNFPATPGAYDNTANGVQDGLVMKLNSALTVLNWSTYIGGTGYDCASAIRLNSTGEVYVCGTSGSMDNSFPVTAGAYATSFFGGPYDGFLLKLDANGSNVLASTLFGSFDIDRAYLVDIDADDDVYIFGEARAAVPVTPGVYSVPGSATFIAKFNPSLSALLFSTVIGNGTLYERIVPTAFRVDSCEKIYFTGFGATQAWPITPDAIYSSDTIGNFYLATLSANATSLLFASFYAGDHTDGGTNRFDPDGVLYHSVCQQGSGFPVASGAWNDGTSAPTFDVCVFKIDFEQQDVVAGAIANPRDTGCAPFDVHFVNTGNGVHYTWNFGDGSPVETTVNPDHVFDSAGVYTVTVIAIDSAGCGKTTDTAYITITVLSGFSFDLGPDTSLCNPVSITLDANVAGASYLWSTGDVTQAIIADEPGVFWVTVTQSLCSLSDTIRISPFDFAPPSGDVQACPGTVVLLSANNPGSVYLWNTGETTADIEVNSPGTYWVEITHGNCTTIDTMTVEYASATTSFPPNVFTPNGDGVNDRYDVSAVSANEFRLEIYDRWGAMIFMSVDPAYQWDGRYNDDDAAAGVYYWILQDVNCAGEPGTQTGFVHLIREK